MSPVLLWICLVFGVVSQAEAQSRFLDKGQHGLGVQIGICDPDKRTDSGFSGKAVFSYKSLIDLDVGVRTTGAGWGSDDSHSTRYLVTLNGNLLHPGSHSGFGALVFGEASTKSYYNAYSWYYNPQSNFMDYKQYALGAKAYYRIYVAEGLALIPLLGAAYVLDQTEWQDPQGDVLYGRRTYGSRFMANLTFLIERKVVLSIDYSRSNERFFLEYRAGVVFTKGP